MGMWVYLVMIFPTISSPPVEALTEKRIACAMPMIRTNQSASDQRSEYIVPAMSVAKRDPSMGATSAKKSTKGPRMIEV